MTPPPSPIPPRAFKLVAIACIASTSCTGVFAASETMSLMRLEEVRSAQFQDPQKAKRPATSAAVEQHLSQLEGMRGFRGTVLGLLSVACAVCFVAATRMLSPPQFPREGVRRLLGHALATAVVLRTIDGAQQAAIATRVRDRYRDAVSEQFPEQDPQIVAAVQQLVERMFVPAQLGLTVLVVSALFFFFTYFRSDAVQQFIAQSDARLK